MCEPTTIAILGIASTALGVFASIQQGQQQAAAANYQATVARNNAISASAAAAETKRRGEVAAQDAIARGRAEEAQNRIRVSQLLGRQRAVIGGSGALVGAGSAAEIEGSTAGLGELDALNIRNAAEREALAIRTQASDVAFQQQTQASGFQSSAALSGAAASQASTSGFLNAGSTLLSGAGSVASKWYGFNRQTGGIN